jgi:peptide/nickel transport system ATP-binding protein
MASIPRLDLMRGAGDTTKQRLQEIKGIVPPLTNLPPGCPFAPRCPHAIDICRREMPAYEEKEPEHWAACWRSKEVYGAGHA